MQYFFQKTIDILCKIWYNILQKGGEQTVVSQKKEGDRMTKNDLVVIIAMLESVAAELEASEMTEAAAIIKNRIETLKTAL